LSIYSAEHQFQSKDCSPATGAGNHFHALNPGADGIPCFLRSITTQNPGEKNAGKFMVDSPALFRMTCWV
jgi:hypothetical protein